MSGVRCIALSSLFIWAQTFSIGVEIWAVWGPELFRNTIVMKPLLNFPRSMDGTVVIHEKQVLAQRVDSGRLQINIVCTLESFWGLQQYSRPIAVMQPQNIIDNRDVVFSIVFSGLYRVPVVVQT